MAKKAITFLLMIMGYLPALAQHSVAREWNEVLLSAIRSDFARPTIHARNLFHIAAVTYDAWAVYDDQAMPYFLNNPRHGYFIPFGGVILPPNVEMAREEAISYACYRIILHRFANSPAANTANLAANNLMNKLGYDPSISSTNYATGSPAHLGNYIAAEVIKLGYEDGANEAANYSYEYYEPINQPLIPTLPGNPSCEFPNRWQPLGFDVFIDQSGNEIPGAVPKFLGPEWGNVTPFSMTEEDKTTYERDGGVYQVYHDPGPPAYINPENNDASADYKWGHSLVAIWSSHLDTADKILWDISPANIGGLRLDDLPTNHEELKDFYNLLNGGDPSSGYAINPKTQQPYEPQIVPRGDYARVLAEFWADGPESETPPGHWFTILNYVNDHPELVKKIHGEGAIVDELEWDVKSYFMLGGAMHDAAISAWGIKGYYDYIRPIAAIRYMADQGQASDPSKPNYNEAGILLVDGYIEQVEEGDSLAGSQGEHIGKIKLYAWRGPDYIQNEEIDHAGVGWILAENWWPYQRPTFITPPFAGYVSGHSTYSRAAASVLASFTGDEYFPGGMGEFHAPKNEFLVFEEGPSVDVVLQWAKYYDASDQCSLSRIWGGIHPPVDDIPGRRIGDKIGQQAFELANKHFDGSIADEWYNTATEPYLAYPNPVGPYRNVNLNFTGQLQEVSLYDSRGALCTKPTILYNNNGVVRISLDAAKQGLYVLKVITSEGIHSSKLMLE